MNDISNNAADFSRSLLEMAEYTNGTIERIIRKACIDLYRAIVEKTPVDTGRAKASWGISVSGGDDVKPDDVYSESDISAIVNENASSLDFEIRDDRVTIYNNLEYISVLESGTGSQQAPQGMVAISLSEFTSFFNEAIRELGGDL